MNNHQGSAWRGAVGNLFFGSSRRAAVTIVVLVILVVTGTLQAFINAVFTGVVVPIFIGVLLIAIAASILPGRHGGGKH